MTARMKLIRPQRRPYPREGDEDLSMSVRSVRDRSIDIVILRCTTTCSIVIPYGVPHHDRAHPVVCGAPVAGERVSA